MKFNKLPEPSEHQQQAALFKWAAVLAHEQPELGLLFAIPNGGHRHPAVARKLKAEGVKAGVPDIYLPVARSGYHGLFIEFKTKKGRLSVIQSTWLGCLKDQGYAAVCCHGVEKAKGVILRYLNRGL